VGQTNEDAAGGDLLLEDVTLVDGTGAAPAPGRSVLVRQGRVAAVYAAGSRPTPPGVPTRRLTGHVVIPGLIDAHVHVTYPFTTRPRQDSIRALLFRGGVTTVRDMAGDAVALAALAAEGRDPRSPTPRVHYSAVFAGATFMRTDRRLAPVAHGMTPGEAPWLRAVDDSTDVARAVEVARWAGATGVKLYADLSPRLVERVATEARRQGLRVWGHSAIIPASPGEAVRAGVEVLSHADVAVLEGNDTMPSTVAGYGSARRYDAVPVSSPAVARLIADMRARGTLLEPTLYVSARQHAAFSRDTARRHLWPMLDWAAAFTRAAHAAGVPVVAGTDLMGRPAADTLPFLHDELELLVRRAGLTPLEAITAATRHGARALGIEREYGTVAVGKVADLVVLRADPIADIANTRSVVLVVKGGVAHAPR
jgi:imidazolonepropionase-like amidohydrolase